MRLPVFMASFVTPTCHLPVDRAVRVALSLHRIQYSSGSRIREIAADPFAPPATTSEHKPTVADRIHALKLWSLLKSASLAVTTALR